MSEQTIADLGEFGFVELLKSRLAPASQVLLGLGDDAAIVQLDSSRVVASTDTMARVSQLSQIHIPAISLISNLPLIH